MSLTSEIPEVPLDPIPDLQLRLFGALSVRVTGTALPPLRTRKGAWLLALLVLKQPRPVDRVWLAGTLWPDSDHRDSLKNLRNTLSDLRHALGSQQRRLHSPTPSTLCLDLAGAEADVEVFDACVKRGDPASLTQAVGLYAGPLLEGCDEEWVVQEREQRQQACLNALETLAAAEMTRGEASRAVQWLRRCVGLDALRETAQCALLTALAACGDYAGATETYRSFRLLLHEELHTQPAATTTALYQQIRVRARQAAHTAATTLPASAANTRRAEAADAEARLPDVFPNNLPSPLTSFVGREQEIAEVTTLLGKTRLMTLTGIGGCGKTRLSLQVATEVLDKYPDGVWLVELASLSNPTLVPQTVASVLGLMEQAGKSLSHTLTESLKARKLLLLLDNCEHLLEACAQVAAMLLRSCPEVHLLVTSRQRLGIAGEQTYRVPSLAPPDLGQTPTVESVGRYDAVRLFIERALLVKSDFAIHDGNAAAVASVCYRLDGIPLAIELAAARLHSLAVEEIHTRLDNRFRLLTGGDRSALPRQQTLRALIDWSYDLLNIREKTLLTRLSVFTGGCTLEAAERVAGFPLSRSDPGTLVASAKVTMRVADDRGPGVAVPTTDNRQLTPDDVLDLLTDLVDKSLVIAETQGDVTRYRLLETVRQYTRDRLAESEEGLIVRGRHRDYFLTLAEEIRPKLNGVEQAHWLSALEKEHDNLRQAVTFCLEEPEGGEAGLRLGAALQPFWQVRGHLSEGRDCMTAVLRHPGGQEPTCRRADVLNGVGLLAWMQGDYILACSLHEESLEIQRTLRDRQGIANSLNNLGLVANDQGDNTAARSLHEQSLEIRRELGHKLGIATSLNNLGILAYEQDDYVGAHALLRECLDLFRELGDKRGIARALLIQARMASDKGDITARAMVEESLRLFGELGEKWGIAWSLLNLGRVANGHDEFANARKHLEESLSLFRELGDRQGIAYSLLNLGMVMRDPDDCIMARKHLEESLSLFRELRGKQGIVYSLLSLGGMAREQGDDASARTYYADCLAICREIEDRKSVADSLKALAELAVKESKSAQAVALWGAAEALQKEIHVPLSPDKQEPYDREVAAARHALGDEAFTTARAKGRAMTLEEAVALALEGSGA